MVAPPSASKPETPEDAAAVLLAKFARGHATRRHMEADQKASKVLQRIMRGKLQRDQVARKRADVLATTNAAVTRKGGQITRVNDYRITRLMGSGAYGKVFSAKRSGSGDVAIKVLSRSILLRKRVGKYGSAFDGVMGEIAVMKSLDHPNIVRLIEVIDDPDEDALFLVMEHVGGGDLSVPITQKRRVPESELRVWLRGLFLGLEHLHLSGVTHRDIKPENILWEAKTAMAKLSDFGVSAIFERGRLGADFHGKSAGTLAFYAPEMCVASGGVGYAGRPADVWACGISLYMWLYHRLPHEADSVVALMAEIASGSIRYPAEGDRDAPPSISAELRTLLHKLLAPRPRDRPRCRDLRSDAFITRGGLEPLPPPASQHVTAVPHSELPLAIQRVKLVTMALAGRGDAAAAAADADADAVVPVREGTALHIDDIALQTGAPDGGGAPALTA